MYLNYTCILLIVLSDFLWNMPCDSTKPLTFHLLRVMQLWNMESGKYISRESFQYGFSDFTLLKPVENLHTGSNGRRFLPSHKRWLWKWGDGEAWIKRSVGVSVQRRQQRYRTEKEKLQGGDQMWTDCCVTFSAVQNFHLVFNCFFFNPKPWMHVQDLQQWRSGGKQIPSCKTENQSEREQQGYRQILSSRRTTLTAAPPVDRSFWGSKLRQVLPRSFH